MEFKPIPCHESLRPFIRNYWMLKAHCTKMGTQQMFSNGAATLHFYLTQEVQLIDAAMLHQRHDIQPNETAKHYQTALFHQNMQTVGVVTQEGDFEIFGAEFVPFCSRVFFRKEMPDVYVSPEELEDNEFVTLSQKVHKTSSLEERVALLDTFFLKRLAEFPEGDVNIERLNDVFDDIVPTDGTTARPPHSQDEFTPVDLASTACLSQKQFTRVFSKYVGMNPKSYLRLLRFHKALQMLKSTSAGSGPSFTEIAYDCGYYDSSHMISDFRDICGLSPSELANFGTELTEAFGQQFSGLMKKKIKIENLI